MAFTLPDLPYAYDALEPYIDARTMEIHHTKHHQGYTNNLNAALRGTDYEGMGDDIASILHSAGKAAEVTPIPAALRNNGGGFANHCLFWSVMGAGCGGDPTGDLAVAIGRDFGSVKAFRALFEKAAATRFGSGWAWLVYDPVGARLEVYSTANQDSPYMGGHVPLLGLDVWEHAYYLKYQNRRPEYISAFWHVVNWAAVADLYAAAPQVRF